MTNLLRQAWRRLDRFLKVDVNPDPVTIADFSKSSHFKRWRVFSDAMFGGNSKGTLTVSDDGQHAVFQGRYSKVINDDSPLVRSGYVGMNTVLPRPANLALHDYLEWRVRAHDGHSYVASVRTDQYTGGDEEAWQAPLKVTRIGEWENVRVNLDDLVFSFRGRMVQNQQAFAKMPRRAVIAIGITLSASKDMPLEGDFGLDVAHVVAGAVPVSGIEEDRKAWQGYMEVVSPTDYDKSSASSQLSTPAEGGPDFVLGDMPTPPQGSQQGQGSEKKDGTPATPTAGKDGSSGPGPQ